MTIRRLAAILCGALALAACATDPQGPARARTGAAASPATPTAGTFTAQNEALLYLNVVNGLVKQQRYGAALAFLDDYAATRKAIVPRYWLLRGEAALGLGRRADAASAYAKLDGTPLAAQGWNGQGRIAAVAKAWRDAAVKFRKAVEGDPSNADFLNNLAFAELHLSDSDAAAGHLRQAHELAPGSELIRNNLIIALTLSGDRRQADVLLLDIPDSDRRQQVRATVERAIESNNRFRDGQS
jgi:Flp pilus assembly protein TadD